MNRWGAYFGVGHLVLQYYWIAQFVIKGSLTVNRKTREFELQWNHRNRHLIENSRCKNKFQVLKYQL